MATATMNTSMNTTVEEDGFCMDDAVLGAKCIAWALHGLAAAAMLACWWLATGFWLSMLALFLAAIAARFAVGYSARKCDEHISVAQKASIGRAVGGFMNRFSRKG